MLYEIAFNNLHLLPQHYTIEKDRFPMSNYICHKTCFFNWLAKQLPTFCIKRIWYLYQVIKFKTRQYYKKPVTFLY